MKLNNKGFAIASILYSIMVLFLLLLLSILGILGSRKAILDKNKKDILNSLNSVVTNNRINFEHRNITIVNSGNTDDILFALMDGVTAIDKDGNQINSGNISYNLNINNIENKDYTVTYTAKSGNNTIIGTRLITFTSEENITDFDYIGEEKEFIPSYNGSYKLELWGAQGGNNGGNGGYTSGNISLNTTNNLYVYVGGLGLTTTMSGQGNDNETTTGGYNGGGSALSQGNCCSDRYWGSGGGSTDVRIESINSDPFGSLKSRIMVAGAGGGSYTFGSGEALNGGPGGTLNGLDGEQSHSDWGTKGYGGTQTLGGYTTCIEGTSCATGWNLAAGNYYYGGFGYGGTSSYPSAGGGSGYYGGGSSFHVQSAGGGSSFISGYDGCDAIDETSTIDNIIHTGKSIHYSGYTFDNPIMYAGNESMPTYDGTSTMIGNSGNGHAKISLIYYY